MPTEFAETRERDELRWVEPIPGNRYHELRSRKGVHAKLKWKEMYGSLAYVHTGEGTYTLKRGGFLRPRVIVRTRPRDSNLAVFDVGLGVKGTIEFKDGPKFDVRRPSPVRRQWTVVDWNDSQVLTIKGVRTGKFTSLVTVKTNPRNTKRVLLMAAIVWYAFILSTEEWTGEPEITMTAI